MDNLNSPKQVEDIKNQVLRILDNVEIAPGTQIYTGQIGTSQIPESMDVVIDDAVAGKATSDSYRDLDIDGKSRALDPIYEH